jgi:hypothetical protein
MQRTNVQAESVLIRRYQFRLRHIFVLITLSAVAACFGEWFFEFVSGSLVPVFFSPRSL